ncbi:MAG TPA: uroporphyrinogen-III synthase [Candidatus Saccharimonadales bacterium]|nr:uroporphyrinogen-III synthase [Candidatus Saccharimonadales bacterium]
MTASLPLAGRRILVTRTREQAGGLVDRLHGLGASVVVVPLIATEPVATPEEILRTANEIRASAPPRWAAFTSATAVRLVVRAAGAEVVGGMQVAAVGLATADALGEAGVTPDVIASDPDADGLAASMLTRGMAGATVWFPSADAAAATLPAALTGGGATVIVQCIYRSVMPAAAPDRLRAALGMGIDAITLTSGSTARNLTAALGDTHLPPGILIACIGEQTAAEARAAGLRVGAVAPTASAEGLVAAVRGCLAPQPLR